LLECFVHDIAFDGANGNCSEAGGECTGLFTQAVLWADAPTNLRQAVGFMTQLGGFEDASFTGQLEPVGNVVVDRALPLAIGVAAIEAALSL
jgi:hypothetical protein